MTETNFSEATESQQWLTFYEEYLAKVLGVALATQRSYLVIVKRLLSSISPTGRIDSSMFTADAIIEFVRRDAAPRSGQGPRATIASVRSFLRFLVSKGVVSPGLEAAVPRIRCSPQALLPQQLSKPEIEQLLAVCADNTARGRRNYALLLILSRLGLRAEEAARLQLDDFDWVNGSVLIRSGKTHRERVLPLAQDVAEAVLSYLQNGRTAGSHREIFLQSVAPFNPSTASSIGKIVKRLLFKAGIRRPGGGHLFRHTVATQMINQGATFKQVADLLGHQSLRTTAVYAKLDLATLSQIALSWPGGGK